MLNIHTEIKEKLNYFHKIHKIPNIIFHGPSGCGKKTIIFDFINKIYENIKEKKKDYVFIVNCSHGKGIKFIREHIKFFAKKHIYFNNGDIFKSIVLLNADKLTIDAQSALRRCIETFCHNTRFFIIVENKQKLLKPILSRFCEIYVPECIIDNKHINLNIYNSSCIDKNEIIQNERIETLKKELNKILRSMKSTKVSNIEPNYLIELSNLFYEKAYSGLDFIYILENTNKFKLSLQEKYNFLLSFNLFKKEVRNEKLIILFILNFIFSTKDYLINNILSF
jgi:hypothetical protein